MGKMSSKGKGGGALESPFKPIKAGRGGKMKKARAERGRAGKSRS